MKKRSVGRNVDTGELLGSGWFSHDSGDSGAFDFMEDFEDDQDSEGLGDIEEDDYQSAAFKILQTRLGAVPSYSFSGDRTSSESYPQISKLTLDGPTRDGGDNHNGVNFTLRLQQFEQMRRRHRMHTKSQMHARHSTSSTISQEVQRTDEHQRHLLVQDGSRAPSRSSWRGS